MASIFIVNSGLDPSLKRLFRQPANALAFARQQAARSDAVRILPILLWQNDADANTQDTLCARWDPVTTAAETIIQTPT